MRERQHDVPTSVREGGREVREVPPLEELAHFGRQLSHYVACTGDSAGAHEQSGDTSPSRPFRCR